MNGIEDWCPCDRCRVLIEVADKPICPPVLDRARHGLARRASGRFSHGIMNESPQVLTITRKRGNSVKFTGEREIFTGEVPLFTGEVDRLSASCRGAA